MALALRRRGVLATLRQSAGQDVDAGCGQLRARTVVQVHPRRGATAAVRPAA
jgi:23S rRNA (adenine2503-C2)-methyltransferase